MNHTPKPWSVRETRTRGITAIVAGNGSRLANVFSSEYITDCTVTEIERIDNAILIAAAPELLDALTRILPHAELIINSNHADWQAATAAIKKATT